MHLHRRYAWALLFYCSLSPLFSQARDTLYLLADKHVEYEAISALDSMYNFQFKAAQIRFHWLRQEYPTHPLPYFLLGLNEWWKMMPNAEEKAYDKDFERYMNASIDRSKQLIEEGLVTEGSFLAAAAYAFLSRFYGERKEWIQATWTGKSALHYLDLCREKKSLSTEILLGEGLYNYYSVWIRDNYPKLRILLFFFGKGDKALGLEQLNYVAKNAFYSRIEAQHFLMRILNEEQEDKREAFHISEYLHRLYPNNAYFHRYYARMLYEMSNYGKCYQVCEEILKRVERKQTGYEGNSGRYASFFLGWIHQQHRQEPSAARPYYQQSLVFAQQAQALCMGYSLRAILELGDIAVADKRYEKAQAYYSQVRSLSERGSKFYKEARSKQRSLKKRRKSSSK